MNPGPPQDGRTHDTGSTTSTSTRAPRLQRQAHTPLSPPGRYSDRPRARAAGLETAPYGSSSLEERAAGSRLEGQGHVDRLSMDRQNDHLALRNTDLQDTSGFEAIHPGHRDSRGNNVRLQSLCRFHERLTVHHRPHDLTQSVLLTRHIPRSAFPGGRRPAGFAASSGVVVRLSERAKYAVS